MTDEATYAMKAGRLDGMYSSLVWKLERQLARWEQRYAELLEEMRESDASDAEAWGSAQGRRLLYEEHIGTLRLILEGAKP